MDNTTDYHERRAEQLQLLTLLPKMMTHSEYTNTKRRTRTQGGMDSMAINHRYAGYCEAYDLITTALKGRV